MSAERLREAAHRLRAHAEHATFMAENWHYDWFREHGLDAPESLYIETLPPGAGLLVAELLDVCATCYDLDHGPECDECLAAKALADAILGGE